MKKFTRANVDVQPYAFTTKSQGKESVKKGYRVVSIGSEIYSSGDSAINLLQASWHPDSDTHLRILSSNVVVRLFNLSSDAELPEQEYYLQLVEPGRSRTASSIDPADFSFGGDHLCDRFT